MYWLLHPPLHPSFSSWSRHMPSGCRRLPDTSLGLLRSRCHTSPNSSAKAHQEGSYTQVGPQDAGAPFSSEVLLLYFASVFQRAGFHFSFLLCYINTHMHVYRLQRLWVAVHSQARHCWTNDCRLVNINEPHSLQCCRNQRLVKAATIKQSALYGRPYWNY